MLPRGSNERFYNLGPVGGVKGQHLTLSTRWLSHDFGGNFSYAIENQEAHAVARILWLRRTSKINYNVTQLLRYFQC